MATNTVFEKDGTRLTVRPEGRLDTATSPVVEEEILAHMDGIREMIIDFSKVEYISSGGLRMLLAVEQTLEDRDGVMKLIHVNRYIIEIFDMVGFTDMVEVEHD